MTSSNSTETVDDRTYQVVVNHEEQHSIWAVDRDIPAGWESVGVSGTKAECLSYIDKSWTDITPLSVRRRLTEASS